MTLLPSARFLKLGLCTALVPLFLAACGPDSQQLADRGAVQRSGVSPAIYDKMVHDDNLSLSDVVALSQARVNDGVIIRYIRDHDTAYYLSPPDFQYLRKNGVDQSVIDFMAQTAPGYGYGPGPYGPGPYGPGYGPGPIVPIGIGIGIGGGGYHHWR
jgi:hypothetical protein